MIILTLFLNSIIAHASPLEVSRRGFMLGSASVAVMAKLPCAQIIAPLEEAPKALAARSTLFSEALRFWPKWASELDPSQPHFFPAYRLNVHDNPSFVALAREKRFSLVEEYLLKSEKTIEQKLSDLPFRVAVRTGMPMEKARISAGFFSKTT